MMSVALIGALVFAGWIGLGMIGVWFLLHRTRLLDGVRMRHGLTADDLRKHFKLIAAAFVGGAATMGWFGGPALFGGLR